MPVGHETVSVVVTTYTTERMSQLRRCVDGILSSRPQPDEVLVVVDNHDDLFELLTRELGPRGVKVCRNQGKGASAGRNTGVEESTGSLIVFIDDDVRPSPQWLGSIVAPLVDRPEIVSVGGHIEPDYEDGAVQLPSELLWLVGCTYKGHPTGPGLITRPIGSTMAFRREALKAVGGFCSEFGPNGEVRVNSNEELAISELIRSKYGPECIWYEPSAVVHHWVPASRCVWRYIARRSMVEGQSKAEIRRRYGSDAMGHDGTYVTGVLLPGVLRRAVRGPRRDAVLMAAVGAVTAGAYSVRRTAHQLARATRSDRSPQLAAS